MCQVFCIAGIKEEHEPKIQALAKSMLKIMGRSEPDGFGYAAITKDGNLFGERWLNKDDVFNIHEQPNMRKSSVSLRNVLGDAGKFGEQITVYNSFGNIYDMPVAMIVHARKQTQGEKGIINTHPFVEGNTALIHNGTIINHGQLTKKYSTCDSETLLHEYIKEKVVHNPYAVDNIADKVVGIYAVGVLTKAEDTPVMDIFKSNKPLFAAYINETENIVYVTNKYALEEALKDNQLTYDELIELKDGHLIRVNAITGERTEDTVTFKPSPENWTQKSVTPINKKDDHLAESKKSFEDRHSEIFTTVYYQPGDSLNEKEKKYMIELKKDKLVNHKALRLVERLINA